MSSRQWYQIRNTASTGNQSPEILIYGEIDSVSGVDAAEFVADVAAIDAPELTVRINSIGGDVFDAIAIRNALLDHKARITTIVDGIAASSASFIATAGDDVVMNKNAQFMCHNAWAIAIGDADTFARTADVLRMQNANIAAMYADKAGGTVDDWLAIMAAETWMTADEAVEAGLADRVIELEPKAAAAATRAAASFDRSRFRYPDRHAAPAPRIAARAHTSPRKEPPAMAPDNSRPRRTGRADSVIDAAIREGKISASSRQQFLDYFNQDPAGCQNAIAAIVAIAPIGSAASAHTGRPGATPAVDHAMNAVYAKIVDSTAAGPRNLIANVDASGQPADLPVTGTVVTTFEAMNEKINADPGLQRMAWELGIKDGINKPPESYEAYPTMDLPGTPRLVDHGEGTGHWETNQWPELQ